MAQGNKLSFKYLKTGTLTDALKVEYKDSIVFVESENAIYTHGVKYGIDPDSAKKITDLESAVSALLAVKHFGGIKVGTQTWTPATDGASIEFTGGGATLVSVTGGKLNITSTDFTNSIADAKKAGTDANSALEAYKTTNNAAVKAAKDAADAAQTAADGKVASVTGSNAIAVTNGTAPVVSLKIDPSKGNVELTLTAAGLKAQVTIPEAQVKGVKAGDKVIALDATAKTLSSTLGLTYDETNKKIKLTGIGNTEIASIDAKAFIKDGMVNTAELIKTAEAGVTEEVPYIKLTFNADGGNGVIRFSVKDLVDVYDGSNLKLKTPTKATSYTAPAANDSVDTAIGKLVKGIEDAKAAGTSANTALESYKSENDPKVTKALTDATKGITDAATALAEAKKKVASVKKGTDGTYVTTTIAGTSTDPTIGVAVTTQAVASATTTAKGLAEASDVKAYVDNQLTWEEL